MPRNTGHSRLSRPEENTTDQNQPEEIQPVTMQLRQIGDSVHRRMIQEHLPQEAADALGPFVELMFLRGQALLRFFWNNHLL
uniref:Peroxisomal, testis specific 1 n=1 Tax=Peromyscus maniculatus bairdii TaxID=230844 RepID=A0A6J0DML6_PERMB